MTTLYTVAYPVISTADAAFIEAFRYEHDPLYRNVIAAHFTMVFGCSCLAEPEYTAHIKRIASDLDPIDFVCRHAMLYADDKDGGDTAYVFLVPDEGYSAISLLHDKLYTGVLQPYLKLEIPYIPHITIGTMKDLRAAKALCDDLNSKGVQISGRFDVLTICALEDGRINDLSPIQLGA